MSQGNWLLLHLRCWSQWKDWHDVSHHFIGDNSLERGYILAIVVIWAKGITVAESKATEDCRRLARSIRRELLQERAGLIPDNARHAHDAAAKIHEILPGTLCPIFKKRREAFSLRRHRLFHHRLRAHDAIADYLSGAFLFALLANLS